MHPALRVANAIAPEIIAFAQQLVRTPSPSGQEGECAELVLAKMQQLGYDQAWADEAGNAIGCFRGSGAGQAVLLNGHLDHVDPGPESSWLFPPYAGAVANGRLHGRGAADMKGGLAAAVYSAAILQQLGCRPAGDLIVAAVVQEEVGGLGTVLLLSSQHVRPKLAIVAEPSSLQLRRGHRGRAELLVDIRGRSVHASAPERAANPFYSLANFLLRLRELPFPPDPDFSGASVAPTLLTSDQTSSNVTPGELTLHLDYRSLPGEEISAVVARFESLLRECLIDGCTGHVRIDERLLRTYTGKSHVLQNVFPAYKLPPDDPHVAAARQALLQLTGKPPEVGLWRFSTDGGHLAAAGIPTIGYGPGEEALVHTAQESIRLEEIVQAAAGYAVLSLALSQPATGS
jgi:putative selenium metabolism hydrolase